MAIHPLLAIDKFVNGSGQGHWFLPSTSAVQWMDHLDTEGSLGYLVKQEGVY
jgi:hypothetical protein